MFIYCFDKEEKNKLQKQLELYDESYINHRRCWIFVVDNINKFNFNEVDKSKCIISNKLRF